MAGDAVETLLSREELLAWAALPHRPVPGAGVNPAGLSGFEAQERLLERGLASPIVFITALDDAPPREGARRGGEVRYLRKPFDDQTLIAEIRLARAAGADQRTV